MGNWTKDLEKLVKTIKVNNEEEESKTNIYPKVFLDGPYGAPAQNHYRYKHIMLIASGIGATPFASIMKDLLYRFKHEQNFSNTIISVDFYWLQRKASQVTWLINILTELMIEDDEKFINFNIFYTCPNQKYDFRSFFLWHGLESLKRRNKNDVSVYCGNIFWSRPDWDELFYVKSQSLKKGSEVGVFVCGNNELCKDIYHMCRKYSYEKTFSFNKEIF